MRDHHGAWGEEEPQLAERPGARQKEIDQQADHHRRQSHQRIQGDDHRAPPGETLDRERRAERQAEKRGERHGSEAHFEAEKDDAPQLEIELENPLQAFRHCPHM